MFIRLLPGTWGNRPGFLTFVTVSVWTFRPPMYTEPNER
ncbi:hypothetical protein SAMN00790413_00640 [Deinococcus hopiensis KR-140]|uniref:Uncharacterized protein n=1 Tax=Deinococcus hopiensis KR-140 TaxID=695939 RepID=A0A1W1V9V8_9DEIO|nr:hypothetical protein SAMN00790413_00640 [Deinococcus hopiensis KR-140]